MTENYFYQESGQTVGPLSLDLLKERIKDGRLRVFDLVYKDGEAAWRMALEHSVLRSEFKSTTLASLKDRPWICLQKKATDSLDFQTNGPFSSDEIRQSLQLGKIGYSDYAWKDGFPEWKRIGGLEEFNPRVAGLQVTEPAKAPEPPAKELLKNVVELKRAAPPEPEQPPPEAKIEPEKKEEPIRSKSKKHRSMNATPPPLPQNPPPPKTQTLAPLALEQTQITETRVQEIVPIDTKAFDTKSTDTKSGKKKSSRDKRRERSRKLPLLDWALVAALILVLAGFVLIVSRYLIPKSKLPQVFETAPVAESPILTPPVESAPAPQVSNDLNPPQADIPPPTPTLTPSEKDDEVDDKPEAGNTPPPKAAVKAPPKQPHELVLAVQNVSSNQARIEIRTDGSADFPVYVQVVGLPGQVAEGGAFYRYLRFVPSGNAREPLDLSGLKLPQGRFILRAETGTLKRESRLNMGVNDPAYKSAVAHQRKMWAHAIWRERLQLMRLAQTMEKSLTTAMVPTKKFSSKGLEPLNAVKRSNGGSYFLYEDWWELHQIAKDAKSGVSNAMLARAQKERDRIASLTVWK